MRIGWLATGLLVFAASAGLRAQGFYATGGGGQIIGGTGTGHTDTLYIDPSGAQGQFPMPWIYLHYTGTQTCPAPQVRIAFQYTDPATGNVLPPKYSVVQAVGGGVVASYSPTGWFGDGETESFGGSDAEAQYSLDNGQNWTTFVTFTILGVNPSQSQVDSYYSGQGAPWFWESIMYEEADGKQFNSAGLPNVAANPDGIGIAQVDGVVNPGEVDGWLYFNYEDNIYKGLNVLSSKKSESYSNWTTQLEDSGYDFPADTDYAHCQFTADITAPPYYGDYDDADWMQDYNAHSDGHWFLWWVQATSGSHWEFKYQTNPPEPGAQYVPDACAGAY